MTLSPYLNTTPVLGDQVYLHPSCQVIGDVKITLLVGASAHAVVLV